MLSDNEGPIGIAYRGTACHSMTGLQININEVQDFGNLRYTADIYAHELGHNLGMR